MSVLYCPNDVLRTPGGITSDENTFTGGHECGTVNNRHVPFSELDTDVALDPRKRIVLPDREHNVICWNEGFPMLCANEASLFVFLPLHEVEDHPP